MTTPAGVSHNPASPAATGGHSPKKSPAVVGARGVSGDHVGDPEDSRCGAVELAENRSLRETTLLESRHPELRVGPNGEHRWMWSAILSRGSASPRSRTPTLVPIYALLGPLAPAPGRGRRGSAGRVPGTVVARPPSRAPWARTREGDDLARRRVGVIGGCPLFAGGERVARGGRPSGWITADGARRGDRGGLRGRGRLGRIGEGMRVVARGPGRGRFFGELSVGGRGGPVVEGSSVAGALGFERREERVVSRGGVRWSTAEGESRTPTGRRERRETACWRPDRRQAADEGTVLC